MEPAFTSRAIACLAGMSLALACGNDRPVPTSPDIITPVPTSPVTAPPVPIVEFGRIAFVSDREGSDAIYVANTDGSALRRLTVGEEPAWAPGGSRLAFERAGDIYVIDSNGSRERRVTRGNNPAWSPDGARLAYSAGTDIRVINSDGSGGRTVMDAAIWNTPEAVYSANWPSWSPDGRRLAFVRTSGDDSWSLFVMELYGSAPPRRLGEGAAGSTSWSPDGSRIAFGAMVSPHHAPAFAQIQIVAADGSSPPAQWVIARGFDPDWTPTGNLIFSQFTGPPNDRNFVGSGMRIFMSTANDPLLPEATMPLRPDYSDQQAVWAR